jgi:hypothetical protein
MLQTCTFLLTSRGLESVKHFLETLKKVQSILKVGSDIEQDVKRVTIPFTHIHIFHTRYSTLMEKVILDFGAMIPEGMEDYSLQVKALIWLLFVWLSKCLLSRTQEGEVQR